MMKATRIGVFVKIDCEWRNVSVLKKPHFILIPFFPLHFHLFFSLFCLSVPHFDSNALPFPFPHRVLCAYKAPSTPRITRFFQSTHFVLFLVIVLMMIVVEGDDTQALRNTISSLCSLNSVGKFHDCCVSYDNGAPITLASSTARSCFISGLTSTSGSVLTSLFVIWFILCCSFFLMIVIHFHHSSFSGVFNPENFVF